MNEAMREQHFERITDERARTMYDYLCDACDLREGGMTDPDQMLVGDIAQAEQIKQALLSDIEQRGIGQERHNGRQTYWQENKCVAQLRAYSDQQRKHLAELKLTPTSRKAQSVEIGNDDFEKF